MLIQSPLSSLDRPADLWLALLFTGAVAGAAWRARSLSGGGAVAAVVIGTVALCASWGLGAYLVAWFALASLLSRVGRTRKAERVRGIVEKGDRRDAVQVVANGAVFAIAAAGVAVLPTGRPMLSIVAAAALAAAGADTWATEIGTLLGGRPWSLRVGRTVPTGTSGAVSLAGCLASIAGAVTLALSAAALHIIPGSAVAAVATGGIVGALADTAIGAWWQARRWCPRCKLETEQGMHHCGTPTVRHGGISRLDNDAVNLFCTVVGAATAIGLAR